MKLYKIKEMGNEELRKKLVELKHEIFFLKFKLQLQQVEKPIEVRNLRRDIRRIETILRERSK